MREKGKKKIDMQNTELEKIKQQASGTFGFLSKETTSCLLLLFRVFFMGQGDLAHTSDK